MSSAAPLIDSTVEREGVERLVPRGQAPLIRQVAGVDRPDPTAVLPPNQPLSLPGTLPTPSRPPAWSDPPAASRPAVADAACIGALTAIAAVLSTRLWLGLSIAGAFVLAVLTIGDATPAKIAMLGVYAALTVLPVAYLEYRRG